MDPSRPDGAGNGKVRAAMRSLCLLVAALLALAVPPVHAEDEGPPQRLPCFSYGEVARQLKGTYDELAVAFQKLLDDYVEKRYAKVGSQESTVQS